MVKKADIPDHVITSALKLAGDEGWDAVTLPRLADVAGVPLIEVHRVTPNRQAVLNGIGRLVDEAVLAEGAADADEKARDRLFEVIMRRFDFLQDHRPGIIAIADGLRREPLWALCQGPAFERSMRLMLDVARLPARGPFGPAKVRVLGLIYLDIFRTWRADDSDDMAKTMKALDKRLEQAEQLANTFDGGRPLWRARRSQQAQDGEAAADGDEGAEANS